MSLSRFSFKIDDEEFFREVLDPGVRYLFIARSSGVRWRNLMGFYFMTFGFFIFLLLFLAFEGSTALAMALVNLFLSGLFCSEAMRADGQYKIAKIVEALVQEHGRETMDRPGVLTPR